MENSTLPSPSVESPLPPPLPSESLDVEEVLTKDRIKILSWAYYLHGAITMVMVSFLLFHLAIFSVISFIPENRQHASHEELAVKVGKSADEAEMDSLLMTDARMDSLVQSEEGTKKKSEEFKQMQLVMRWLAVAVGLVILAGWAFALLTIYAGKCLANYRARRFVLVMAALNCVFIPYGTILGICTFVLMTKPVSRRLFGLGASKL